LPGGPLGASGLWRHTKPGKTAPPSTPDGRCAKWVLCSSTLAPHSTVSWAPPFLPRPRSPHSLAGGARLACIRWSKRPILSNRSAYHTRGTRSESLPYRSAGCAIANLVCSRSRDHRPEARRRSFRGTDPSKTDPSCLHEGRGIRSLRRSQSISRWRAPYARPARGPGHVGRGRWCQLIARCTSAAGPYFELYGQASPLGWAVSGARLLAIYCIC